MRYLQFVSQAWGPERAELQLIHALGQYEHETFTATLLTYVSRLAEGLDAPSKATVREAERFDFSRLRKSQTSLRLSCLASGTVVPPFKVLHSGCIDFVNTRKAFVKRGRDAGLDLVPVRNKRRLKWDRSA